MGSPKRGEFILRLSPTNGNHRIRASHACLDGFTQGASRKTSTIAKPFGSIDNDQGHVFVNLGILKSVIHQNNLSALGNRLFNTGPPIISNPCARKSRQEQRFIPHLTGAMLGWIHFDWTLKLTPITARDDMDLITLVNEVLCQSDGRRSFPSPTCINIANANYRAFRPHHRRSADTPRGCKSIESTKRREQGGT